MTPACPITAAQDALTLLRSSRAAMAAAGGMVFAVADLARILRGLAMSHAPATHHALDRRYAEALAHEGTLAPPQRAQGREMAPGRPAAPPAPMAVLAAPTGHYRPHCRI